MVELKELANKISRSKKFEDVLNNLKENFDRYRIWYEKTDNQNLTGNTIAVLEKNGKRYVGVSRLHNDDQFDRRRGRQIALGRALAAYRSTIHKTPRDQRLSFVLSNKVSEPINLKFEYMRGKNIFTQKVTIPEWVVNSKEITSS